MADARGVAYGHAAGPELGFEAEDHEAAGDAPAVAEAPHGDAPAEACRHE